MKTQILVIGLSALSCLLSSTAMAASFDRIIVFGDSLSDNGNFYQQSQQTPSSSYPFLPPFPGDPTSPYSAYPGFPYYQGRFSNGPVWVETLATTLNLPTENFASGGAGTGTFHQAGPAFPGMTTQINQYLQSNSVVDPDALYILSAGSNDYSDPSYSSPADIMTAAIGNISFSLAALSVAGARNFMIVGVPDFGHIPVSAALPEPTRASLSYLSSVHNNTLMSLIPNWSAVLNANITFLNIDTPFTESRNNPSLFRFTNVTDGCLFNPICATNPSVQDEYLFWDASHPTAAAHRHISSFALTQLQTLYPQSIRSTTASVPEPFIGWGIWVTIGVGGWLSKKMKAKQSQ